MRVASIIIPVHNHASITRQCLTTLFAAPPRTVTLDVIVVDVASSDVTPRVLADFHDKIRVVTLDANRGFGAACNAGAARATGEMLIFLNNDTIPQPGWLDALVAYHDAHPAAAVVGSKMLFPNETVQHAGVVIGQNGWPRHLYAGFPGDHPAVNRSRQFQIVTAGCALVRRGPFEDVGGFDTAFRNGAEDVDLCLQLGRRGYEVHYCYESVLYHLESITREARMDEWHHNARLYESRWLPAVRPDDITYYLADGLLQIEYVGTFYPINLRLSADLAVVVDEGRAWHADRLLETRSRQFFALMQENVRLTAQVQDLKEELAACQHDPARHGSNGQ